MSVRSSETQSDVEVFQTCPGDTGSYTVVVQNRKGSAQHTVSLSVIGETHFGLQFSTKSSLVAKSMQPWCLFCFLLLRFGFIYNKC